MLINFLQIFPILENLNNFYNFLEQNILIRLPGLLTLPPAHCHLQFGTGKHAHQGGGGGGSREILLYIHCTDGVYKLNAILNNMEKKSITKE